MKERENILGKVGGSDMDIILSKSATQPSVLNPAGESRRTSGGVFGWIMDRFTRKD